LFSSVQLKICGDSRLGGVGNMLSFASFKKIADIEIIKSNETGTDQNGDNNSTN
jgi:hypothetical protein